MSEEINNFVKSMLDSAKDKNGVKPQGRTDDVNRKDVEDFTERLLGMKREVKKENKK